MEEITHRFIQTNDIQLHIAELGSGPVVLLLHGFPEIWYSWRHQILALAKAGFHAIAPDFRGYGLTLNPPDSDKKDFTYLVEDLVELLHAIHEDEVFVVGKDWGAAVAYLLALLHPELVKGIATLGIPYVKSLTVNWRDSLPEGFHPNRFAIPGRPEADFARFDVKTVIKNIYILFSGSDLQIAPEGKEIMDLVEPSTPLPEWFTEKDLEVYAGLYEKSGFGYAMEVPYRCGRSSLQKALAQVDIHTIHAPALLIVGGRDFFLKFPGVDDLVKSSSVLKADVPRLETVFLPEGNHFMQEQLPEEVNKLLVEFLQTLRSPSSPI